MPKRKTRAYVDFEFCSLEDTMPISLGVVLDDSEHYFEFDGWSIERCSPWVIENVLPHLTGGQQSSQSIASELKEILAAHTAGTIIADNPIDLRLLLSITGTLGRAWRGSLALFAPRTYPDFVPAGLRRHHALDDALALKAVVRHFELEGYNAISEPQQMIGQLRNPSRFA